MLKKISKSPKYKEYLIISILLIILTIAFLWKAFFLGEVLLPADMVNTSVHPWVLAEQNQYSPGAAPHNPTLSDPIFIYYPMKYYLADAAEKGVLPLWNPNAFLGYPYASNVVNEMYNPLDFLFFLIPQAQAFTFTIALHLFLAGIFMYGFARSLNINKVGSFLAAVVFMFNANTILWLEFPTHLKGELWIPLIFLFVIRFFREKRIIFAILAGIFIGMQIHSGYSQSVQFSAIALFVLLCVFIIYDLVDKNYKSILKNVGGLALAGVIGLVIGLCFMVPFYNEFKGSLRAVQQRGGGGSMNFRYLITMVNPNFFGNGLSGSFWLSGTNFIETVRYSGVAVLFLSGIAIAFKRTKIVLSFFAITAVAVLLNSAPQIFKVFNKIIPFFSQSSISRILVLVPFCLAILSAYGMDYVSKVNLGKEWLKRKKIVIFTILLAAFFIGLIVALNFTFDTHISLEKMAEHPLIRLETLSFIFFVVLAVFSVAFIVLAVRTRYRKIFLMLITGLLVVDLFVFGINFNTTSDPDQVYFKTPSIEYIKQDEGLYRNLGIMGGTFNPNSMWIFNMQDTAGYDPVIPLDYAKFWAAFQGSDRVRPNGKVGADKMYANFLKLTNTKYIISYAFMSEMGYFVNNFEKNLNEQSSKNSVIHTWNFQEHIIPTIVVPADSKMEFDYSIKEDRELVFYTSLHPQHWNAETGDGVIYRIYAEYNGGRDLLWEQDLNPVQKEEDRRWFAHRVDLGKYSGKEVKLVFETSSKKNAEHDMPGWGNPMIIPKDSLGLGNLMLAYNKEVKIYRNYFYLPRAFIASNSKSFASQDEILSHLVENHNLDLENMVYLTNGDNLDGEVDYSLEITGYSENSIDIEAEADGACYLVLLDRYDEDWNAYVDGEETEIFKANYMFKAIKLDKGNHEIEFRYEPRWFYYMLAISFSALIICILACIVIYHREKKKRLHG